MSERNEYRWLIGQPVERVSFSSRYPDLQDWDDPPTCVLWPEFRSTLSHVRSHGVLPPLHSSHDHLNKQVEVDVDSKAETRWREAFRELVEIKAAEGVELTWFIVDGFVLYWDEVGVLYPRKRDLNSCSRR